jgi:hypothetical protein
MSILASVVFRILPGLMMILMMILYVSILVYFFLLFRRLVLAVEGIARKIESSFKI